MVKARTLFAILILFALGLQACQQRDAGSTEVPIKVLAVESFLADIAQNVAGDRIRVDTLIPIGLDPHAFEPTPRDVVRINESNVLIINGGGFESWIEKISANSGGNYLLVEASAGLKSRETHEVDQDGQEVEEGHDHVGDPHFWLNPIMVIRYVENIRDGLIQVDPDGESIYSENAKAYIVQLNELDSWIKAQVQQIPGEKRKFVTNHESFGYYADQYGFMVIGTILPGVSTGATPSAQQLARLVDAVRSSGATAVFLETGSNPKLAEQIANETGIKVVTNLTTHSITLPDGGAVSYIDMMRHNTEIIVAALK